MNISRRFIIDDLTTERPACLRPAKMRPRTGRPELTLHLRRRRPVHELTAAPAEIPMVEDVLATLVDGRTEQLLVA
jgi:hypothetical protein